MAAEHPIRRTLTARETAQRMGISPRTVRNIIAEPRPSTKHEQPNDANSSSPCDAPDSPTNKSPPRSA